MKTVDVAIIGGGISGLTLAYDLNRQAGDKISTLLFEARSTTGGSIQTYRDGGLLIDAGPDSFVATKPWALDLIRELGLEGELISPQPEASRIFLARQGKLRPLPLGLVLGISTRLMPAALNTALPLSLKFRMLREFFMKPRKPHGEESVAQLFYRHFGPLGVELLADPILGGIYASRADRLSVAACFPQFLEMEEKFGSLARGIRAQRKAHSATRDPSAPPPSPFRTLRSGMQQLTETLTAKLPAEALKLQTPVHAVRISKTPESFEIETQKGEKFSARTLAVATPTGAAKNLLGILPNVQRALERFQAVSTATVFLSFAKADIKHDIKGFGFIVPRNELSQLLAATWVSSKFSQRAPDDIFLMRCFVGGLGREELVSLSEAELVELCCRELQRWMGIKARPRLARVFYWPKLCPQYLVGQGRKIAQLEQALAETPGLYLLGNAYRGIGIPDCIREARRTADAVLARLALK